MKEKIEKAAKEACFYALQNVLKGSTQLENNLLEESKRKELNEVIREMRRSGGFPDPSFPKKIGIFFQSLGLSTKFSFGNCEELAFLALYYLSCRYPNLRAEVFYIGLGDHAFVVVGRDDNSIDSDPTTWGENAYICDPLAKIVYLASDYKTHLKNFRKEAHFINAFEMMKPFHSLMAFLSSEEIRLALMAKSNTLFLSLDSALSELKKELSTIVMTLRAKYAQDNGKVTLIENLIKRLEGLGELNNPDKLFNLHSPPTRKNIVKLNKQIADDLKTALMINPQEAEILNKHRFFESQPTINSWLQWFFDLVHFFPESKNNVERAIDKFQLNLNNFVEKNLANSPSPVQAVNN